MIQKYYKVGYIKDMRCDFPTNNLEELVFYSLLFTDAEYKSVGALYHYTRAENRNKIIKDNIIDLRFTRLDCFEDKKEAEHVIEMYNRLCHECLVEGIVDKPFYSLMKESVKGYQAVCERYKGMYVFCFSKSRNSEYLKRNYACKDNKDGVIIGIQALSIEELRFSKELSNDNNYPPIYIYDVIYLQDELLKYLKSLIKKAYSLRHQDDCSNTAIKKILVGILSAYGLVFKNAEFSEEEETRVIVDVNRINLRNNIVGFVADEKKEYLHMYFPTDRLYDVRNVLYGME